MGQSFIPNRRRYKRSPWIDFDRFASCENIVLRFQTRARLVCFSLEETLLQPVLKSFITVFIQYNEGLENKLTRAPLLGLAKSIYYNH